MGSISKKLKSERGVTILLALLLFLVCAVTGSVLITAGTAASGTVSERAKLDQRYFSVTSAAELLRNKFDGISVRVTVPANSSDPVSATISHASDNISENVSVQYDDNQIDLQNPALKLVMLRSLFLLQKLDVFDPNEFSQIDFNEKLGPYKLEAKMNDADKKDELTVAVDVKSQNSGLIFKLENDNGDTEKFRLQMDYSASVVQEYGNTYRVDWKMNKVSLTSS